MRDAYIVLIVIAIIIILGAFAIRHNLDTNTWADFDGVVIDKYNDGGWSGTLYCLIQVGEERYKATLNCEEYIVGDKVKVELRISNGDGKKTISYLYAR